MTVTKKTLFISVLFLLFFTAHIYASSFSGNTGGRINYSADKTSPSYNPQLCLEAFFEGQFNISSNIWSHLDFSIKTGDFLNVDLFSAVDSKFKIDEISVIFKTQIDKNQNYFSCFMGTYDPIGSDIFLQRYLGQQKISSKLTESWLGQAASVLYPHFGIGISDVLKFGEQPLALGLYCYFNNEDENYYVFNTDLRFAGVYRFFTFDIAGGIGAPLSDNYKGEEVIVAVEKLYWHAGATLLIGNNYTQGLFMQAGIFNAAFAPGKNSSDTFKDDIYILIEPRFKIKNTHVNLTAWSLPENTVNQLLFIDDNLGINLNIYSESLIFGSQKYTLGTNIAWSFPDKYFTDIKDILTPIKSGDFNINITPYISTNLLSGEIHAQVKLGIMDFIRSNWYDGIGADIGYRVTF